MRYDFIPSKDMRDYLEEKQITLSDLQQACILQNTTDGFEERLRVLEDLSQATDDAGLQKQIMQRIAYDRKEYAHFAENTKRDHVYVVFDENKAEGVEFADQVGFFFDLEGAETYAKERFKRYCIEKYPVADETIPRMTHIVQKNQIAAGAEFEEQEEEYDGSSIGRASYVKGVMQSVWSEEVTMEEMKSLSKRNGIRFEDCFLPIDHPFEKGDFVRIVGGRDVGVVETSREEWTDLVRRVAEGLHADIFDSTLTVEFLVEDRHFSHDHISPLCLERYDIAMLPDSKEKELLLSAQRLLRNEEMLETFLMAYDQLHS